MALYGTVPSFYDPGIPIEYLRMTANLDVKNLSRTEYFVTTSHHRLHCSKNISRSAQVQQLIGYTNGPIEKACITYPPLALHERSPKFDSSRSSESRRSKKMQQKSPGCFQHFCLAFRATHKKDWIRLVGTQTPHEISNFSGLWFILRVHQWGSWV